MYVKKKFFFNYILRVYYIKIFTILLLLLLLMYQIIRIIRRIRRYIISYNILNNNSRYIRLKSIPMSIISVGQSCVFNVS